VGTFGEKFRKERERRGFSLDDVSNVTKIGSRMLKAIEDEHFDQLPGGVFNKGFIRAYARHLGLNDEEAITEYLAALREAQVEAQNSSTPAPLPPARRTAGASQTKSNAAQVSRSAVKPPAAQPKTEVAGDGREELPELQLPNAEHIRRRRPAFGSNGAAVPWTVPALVVLLVLIGILLWNRHSHSDRAAPENATHATPSNSISSAPATTGSASSRPRPTETVSAATPAAPAQQPAPAPTAAPVSRASTRESAPAGANDVTIRNSKPRQSAATTPEPAPGLKLVIRAAENSWVSVVADGQHVTQETLIAPAHTSTRASREIIVKVGNAAGVSFLLNGKEFSAQGNEAEVKTFVFDNTGMRTVASGPGPVPTADTTNQ